MFNVKNIYGQKTNIGTTISYYVLIPTYWLQILYYDSQSADNGAPLFGITVHGAVFAVIDIVYASIQIK